jgi:hypothetical protein
LAVQGRAGQPRENIWAWGVVAGRISSPGLARWLSYRLGTLRAPSVFPFGFELVWGENKPLCASGARKRDKWEGCRGGKLYKWRAENFVLLLGGSQ